MCKYSNGVYEIEYDGQTYYVNDDTRIHDIEIYLEKRGVGESQKTVTIPIAEEISTIPYYPGYKKSEEVKVFIPNSENVMSYFDPYSTEGVTFLEVTYTNTEDVYVEMYKDLVTGEIGEKNEFGIPVNTNQKVMSKQAD